jgi:hypothetical protein
LVRLRRRIEELRFDGQRTTEAEAAFEKFEATHQGLLAKLDTLRREQAAPARTTLFSQHHPSDVP